VQNLLLLLLDLHTKKKNFHHKFYLIIKTKQTVCGSIYVLAVVGIGGHNGADPETYKILIFIIKQTSTNQVFSLCLQVKMSRIISND
jgi:hypothetical protein